MTTEPMRPARIAGLALLGVAAVATVLGVVTLLGGDGDSEAGQSTPPAATTTTAAPPASTTSATGAPTPTTTSARPTTTTAPATTTSEPTAQPTSPGGAPSSQDQPVRVYNNSTIKGLADKASADIEAAGWDVVEIGNHQGRLYETTVYYRPGTPEEAAAKALGAEFGVRVEPRFDGIANADPGVIVIVTKDWAERPGDKG